MIVVRACPSFVDVLGDARIAIDYIF